MASSASQNQMVQFIKSWNAGDHKQAKNQAAKIRDPLATKIINWLQYQDKNWLQNANEREIGYVGQFIRKNPDWPKAATLRANIEKYMPESASPQSIISWYDDYKPKSARGTDMYLQALRDTGQIPKMRLFLQDWWANTPLARGDQKFLFKKYSTYLTLDAHKKRLDTLLFSKQYTNARAVASVLRRGYPELVEARIALAEGKSGVTGLISKTPKRLLSDPGLQYERLRWRRKKDMNMRAIEILQAPIDTSRIHNRKSWWRERHILIRRLLEKQQYDTAYLLVSKHVQTEGLAFAQAEWLAGWLSLQFLDEPKRAFIHFEKLYQGVKSPISKARAAYWGGRAAQAVGRADVANPWYSAAAQFQITFYGQLAAKELSLDGKLPHKPPPILTTIDKKILRQNDLVRTVELFHKAGQRKTAKSFLGAYSKTLNTAKEFRFAAEFAADLGYYNNGIRIAKNATKRGMFLTAQSYPLITDRLRGVKTEWSLVHGLIRQESAFDFDAKSRVGARGLMQLMPATAREVAKKNGISHNTDWLTSRPNHNIVLGSLYLKQMLNRFDGYYPMAIAAYNAGPGRVDKWIKTYGDPRKGDINLVDWVELLPIYETRNYVQRVLEATYVYRLRLKGKEPRLPLGDLHTEM